MQIYVSPKPITVSYIDGSCRGKPVIFRVRALDIHGKGIYIYPEKECVVCIIEKRMKHRLSIL